MRKRVCEGVRQAQRESERVWEREREKRSWCFVKQPRRKFNHGSTHGYKSQDEEFYYI